MRKRALCRVKVRDSRAAASVRAGEGTGGGPTRGYRKVSSRWPRELWARASLIENRNCALVNYASGEGDRGYGARAPGMKRAIVTEGRNSRKSPPPTSSTKLHTAVRPIQADRGATQRGSTGMAARD